MTQTGTNEGVGGTGSSGILVTIDGVGSLFALEFGEGFSAAFRAALLDNTGRGDAMGDSSVRHEDASGSWSGRGRVRGDKRPLPLYLAAASGTIKLAMTAAVDRDGNSTAVNYLSFTAKFSAISLRHVPADSGGEAVWEVDFTCQKSGALTQGWDGLNGTTEAALCPLPAAVGTTGHATHKELLAGMSKTYDVLQSLTVPSSATQRWDVEGMVNNDSSEAATLMTVIGAAIAQGAPFTGGVLARATLRRTGSIGGHIDVAWDLDAVKLGCHTRGSLDQEIARISGGKVQVYVAEALEQSDAWTYLRMGSSRQRRASREFTLTRKITTTTVPDQQAKAHTTNTAAFLGLAAKSVLYLGADVVGVVPSGSVSRTWEMVYHFLWVKDGHYYVDGWRGTAATTATGITGGTWVDVEDLTDSGITAGEPATSDFGVFTAFPYVG